MIILACNSCCGLRTDMGNRELITIEVNYNNVLVAGTIVPRPSHVSVSQWMKYWDWVNKAMEANSYELDRFFRYGAAEEESEEED